MLSITWINIHGWTLSYAKSYAAVANTPSGLLLSPCLCRLEQASTHLIFFAARFILSWSRFLFLPLLALASLLDAGLSIGRRPLDWTSASRLDAGQDVLFHTRNTFTALTFVCACPVHPTNEIPRVMVFVYAFHLIKLRIVVQKFSCRLFYFF